MMNRLLGVVLLLIFMVSCVGSSPKASKEFAEEIKSDGIEVLYFHSKKRCITCNAIETLTAEVINESFAQELEDGTLVMRTIDISTDMGEVVADKYEVAFSSLYINKWVDGVESRNDLTKLGFAKAKNSPDEFKAELKSTLEELLKGE